MTTQTTFSDKFLSLVNLFAACGGMENENNPYYEKLVDFIEWTDTPEEHTKEVNKTISFFY